MYLFGGRGAQQQSGMFILDDEIYSDELWYLDLKALVWHNVIVEEIKPIGRRSHSACKFSFFWYFFCTLNSIIVLVVYDNKMFIFGGYNAVKGDHYNDLHEFDTKNNEWRLVHPIGEPPCKRRRQACILVNDRVFLFGGTRLVGKSVQHDVLLICFLLVSPLSSQINEQREQSDDKLIDHSDMYILDFKTSLKTLCLIAVKRFKLDEANLPHSIKLV